MQLKPEQREAIEKDCPEALPLLDSGKARLEGNMSLSLIGVASDGVEVNLGYLGWKKERKQLSNYLKEHPTPEDW